MTYFRPLVQHGVCRPPEALSLVGGQLWFTHIVAMARGGPSQVVPATDVPEAVLNRLTRPRAPIAGLTFDQPVLMGILNVTPDSFSDGGRYDAPDMALSAALAMVGDGADLIDVGGESTRPGAMLVPAEAEIARTAPVIAALRASSPVAISIDTRKSEVVEAALAAGGTLINDVSGFTFDPAVAVLASKTQTPVCIMQALGDPATMQDDPVYDNVLLDIYDFLESRIVALEALGLPRDQMLADPGIGFGKTIQHNLTLLQNISLFHGLGVPLLLGVSRKGFIGKIGQEPRAEARVPGSIAVGLAALAQGVHILRVHDVAETAQAVRLWQASR